MIQKTNIFKHADISEILIEEICILKSKRWKYSVDQHRKWIKDNLNPNDYHILIEEGETLIAYVNLVDVTAIINGKEYSFKGIGNVCTLESGKGYGNILMEQLNYTLTKYSWKGLLQCKNSLIQYYKKFNWKLIVNNVNDNNIDSTINFMFFNSRIKVNSFEYNDKNF